MMIIDVNTIQGRVKCKYNSEERIFDDISGLIADENWSKLEIESISAENEMIVISLKEFVPKTPCYSCGEEWINNQLGGDIGKAFDC